MTLRTWLRCAASGLVAWTMSAGSSWAEPPGLKIAPAEPQTTAVDVKGVPAKTASPDEASAAGKASPTPPASVAGTLLIEDDAKPAATIDASCPGPGCGFDWSKVPPVRIFPRPGNFPILPSGPGYYSLLDVVTGNYREAPPKFPYSSSAIMPPPLYEADFRYLDDPKNTQFDPFDVLHRIHIGDNFLFSTGGCMWLRYMHELDSRLSGKDNNYDLFRTRVYGDLWYKDRLRIYAEITTAQSFDQDLPPLVIDRNYFDFQNLFVDLKLADIADYPLYVRGGRQEVLLGSQRLISTLDWANTRRTFDGVRVFRQGENFDVDIFWLEFVKPTVTQIDSHDNNQNFAGGWFTYRPQKGTFIDLYYLFLDNTNKTAPAIGKDNFKLATAPFNVHTLAARYAGDRNQVLWDFEAMLQLGERGPQDTTAGAFTTGLGYNFKSMPMNPTFWVYFDYASGDRSPNANDYNTFNQLYPFGHYYFGFLDLVGRQNIQDLNAHVYLYPTKWITLNGQYHHFRLDSAQDALYSAGAVPLRIDPTGAAGKDVGNEIDLLANIHLGAHSDVLVGWSKLWAGDFIRSTGSGRNPELFYLMYNVRW
jgi:Alginate export